VIGTRSPAGPAVQPSPAMTRKSCVSVAGCVPMTPPGSRVRHVRLTWRPPSAMRVARSPLLPCRWMTFSARSNWKISTGLLPRTRTGNCRPRDRPELHEHPGAYVQPDNAADFLLAKDVTATGGPGAAQAVSSAGCAVNDRESPRVTALTVMWGARAPWT